MFKLIGGLLVVAASGLAGWQVSRSYARRPVELRQFISALQLLETEITYAATPLPEALAGVAEQVDVPAASFFRQIAGDLGAHRGCSAREAWHGALECYGHRSALGRGDLSVLRGLGNSIGISDREDQSKHLRLAAEQLKTALAMADAAAAKNVKLWNYMGLLGGLIIVLALY
ncbi:stage III sporulation protein SpoIIIAB [Desulfoscipio gibsoniae]|uniref:Stage III sporulation protein AB n=1 Tax=Desulfoscipio gibsoniae DSM 7213 TaxID=767817 RepID=R4KFS4_9FIRM|nr:stage III sporulation protein SpoIIIAB [Desulfoscipio gibsoniae]AGL02028.1 stage III sporulation protein AB [Desulfoscipio gibsoniae DSM 7213]